jgi:predicted NUDIX family NTP pyrophosphohydrolase
VTVQSAGILLYRRRGDGQEVFLVHPGGPYWAKKDIGAWSIPKGLVAAGEEPLEAARREFLEETGFVANGHLVPLGLFRQPSGKRLSAWAMEGDCEPARLISNSFLLMWPPKSGTIRSFPEVDRGAWFGRTEAMVKITRGQKPVLQKFFDHAPGDA